jgi:uncharacterized membrane protein
MQAVFLEPPTRSERVFGVFAYLSWWSPLWWLTPVVLYFWKVKTSRFVSFHAIQSTILGPMCLVFWCAAATVSAVVFGVLKWPDSLMILAGALPFGASFGMALAMFFGRRSVLPLLGRWTERIITPLDERPIADASPTSIEVPRAAKDRIHAGVAYLSSFVPFLWIWYPLALYFWKGRRGRFIGFHAVQSLLLLLASALLVLSSGVLTVLFYMLVKPRSPLPVRHEGAIIFGMYAACWALPVFMIIGMGIHVMRGGRGVLPLLGRLAKVIIGPKRLPE